MSEPFVPYYAEARRAYDALFDRVWSQIEHPERKDTIRDFAYSLDNSDGQIWFSNRQNTLDFLKELEQQAGQPLLLRYAVEEYTYSDYSHLLPETTQAALRDLQEKLPGYDPMNLKVVFDEDALKDALVHKPKAVDPELAERAARALAEEGVDLNAHNAYDPRFGDLRYIRAMLEQRHEPSHAWDASRAESSRQERAFHELPEVRKYADIQDIEALYRMGVEKDPGVLLSWEVKMARDGDNYDPANPPRLAHDLPLREVSDRLINAAHEVASHYHHMWSWDEMVEGLREAKAKDWGLTQYKLYAVDHLYYGNRDRNQYTGALGPGELPNFRKEADGSIHYSHITGSGRMHVGIADREGRLEYTLEVHRPIEGAVLRLEPVGEGHTVRVLVPEAVHERHVTAMRELVEAAPSLEGREQVLEQLDRIAHLGRVNDFLKDERTIPELENLPVDLRETYRSLLKQEGGLSVSLQAGANEDYVVIARSQYLGNDLYPAFQNSIAIGRDHAILESYWGSDSYWDRWNIEGDRIIYTGTAPDGDSRMMPGWAMESAPGSEARLEAQTDRLVERLEPFLDEKLKDQYDLKATIRGLLEDSSEVRVYEKHNGVELTFVGEGEDRYVSATAEWGGNYLTFEEGYKWITPEHESWVKPGPGWQREPEIEV